MALTIRTQTKDFDRFTEFIICDENIRGEILKTAAPISLEFVDVEEGKPIVPTFTIAEPFHTIYASGMDDMIKKSHLYRSLDIEYKILYTKYKQLLDENTRRKS